MQRKSLILVLPILLTTLLLSAGAVSAQEGDGRPSFPNEQVYGTAHFLIHYTLEGEHATLPEDTDGGGVPDFVEQAAESLEYAWRVEVDEMGWAVPPSDGGRGGDDRIDVYMEQLLSDDIAGYAESGGGHVGDNPNTSEPERHAAFSYLALDNDYQEILEDLYATETPLQVMQATVAHEFNHVLQAGYDDRDRHYWLYEATATWMEDEVYDDINDGYYYLDAVFKSPDTCLVAEGGAERVEDLDHWYGEWLLLRFMSERYGRDIVRVIWEHSRQQDGFDAIDAMLAPFGSTLELETQGYAVANLLRNYEEGADYPTVRLEGTAGIGAFTPADGVQSLGADYVQLDAADTVAVTLTGEDDVLRLQAVGIAGDVAEIIAPVDGTLVLDLGRYTAVYLVVFNAERIADEGDCLWVGYTLDVAPTDAAPTPAIQTLPTINFSPPREEPLIDLDEWEGDDGWADEPFADGAASDPAELDVPFDVLVPATVPDGYEFDIAYTMTPEEFGDSADFYAPGGTISANMDYYNDLGDWLTVAESVSPYGTLDEWLDDIAYDTPGEIETIAGVPALVEDLGDGWTSITIIYNGLFIVVDSDGDRPDAARALVEGLVAGEVLPAAPEEAPPTEETSTVEPTEPVEPSLEPEATAVEPAPLDEPGVLDACCSCPLGMALPLFALGLFTWRRARQAGG